MAGAFSGHLLNTFNSAQPNTQTIVTSGAMSFDARAHGTPSAFSPFFSPSPTPHALFGFTPFTEDSTIAKQIATLQAKLNKKLGPEYISQRPGPSGGPKLTYAEGWKIINLANEVFGFNGWSSSIVNITTDFVDYSEESKRFNVGVTAIVRVTLKDGAYHEDVGYGMLENSKSKAAALDKCKKEAITDALKRTLRNFGNLLGNCLYDKSYAQEVVKIKAKLDKNELHRRPEFVERIPDAPAPAPHGQGAVPGPSSTKRDEPRIKVENESQPHGIPVTYVPRHLRQEMAAAAQQAQVQTPPRAPVTPPPRASTSGSGMINALTNRGPHSVETPKPIGLATPIQTPVQAHHPPPPRAAPAPPRAVAPSPLARTSMTPERSVSFAEPLQARTNSSDTADQDMDDAGQGQAIHTVSGVDDDDDFPLSTQDGALFSMVDLSEGDLGRPIDFEEGVGGIDASGLELEPDCGVQSPVAPPQPQVCDRAGSGSSAGSSSSGPVKANTLNETQARPPYSTLSNASPSPNASTSGGQPHPRSGPASASNTRAGHPRHAMTSMGGYHAPPDTKPPTQQHIPKSVPATPNTPQTGPTNTLKRSVDLMQAGSSTRLPIQGMGLAQRQQQYQQQQQSASSRRPSDNNDGHDPKRFKR